MRAPRPAPARAPRSVTAGAASLERPHQPRRSNNRAPPAPPRRRRRRRAPGPGASRALFPETRPLREPRRARHPRANPTPCDSLYLSRGPRAAAKSRAARGARPRRRRPRRGRPSRPGPRRRRRACVVASRRWRSTWRPFSGRGAATALRRTRTISRRRRGDASASVRFRRDERTQSARRRRDDGRQRATPTTRRE